MPRKKHVLLDRYIILLLYDILRTPLLTPHSPTLHPISINVSLLPFWAREGSRHFLAHSEPIYVVLSPAYIFWPALRFSLCGESNAIPDHYHDDDSCMNLLKSTLPEKKAVVVWWIY